ncbi:hypothetical protein SFRURICE_003777 [Spodoptera frugiperda]|uniref:SFRICE_007996 n=1 Tax=Spodoptera frugiperda TaxID=7108 RepID=A0A2H1WXJ2_SPOFR|nr:hypothetical protein SFRURICE_003777 [Spodoptera frugiperda]
MDPYPYDVIDLTNLGDSLTYASRVQHPPSMNPDEVIELDRDSEDSIYDRDLPPDDYRFGETSTLEELMNLECYKNPKERVAKLKKTIKRRVREYELRMERLEKMKQENIRLEEERKRQKVKRLKQAVREKLREERQKKEKCAVCNEIPKETTFGICPICWEELGDEPMASTTCGHVFCLECIRRYLDHEPKCPTCRQDLVGNNVFHPLYLSQGT